MSDHIWFDAEFLHGEHTQQRLSIGRQLQAAEVPHAAADGQARVSIHASGVRPCGGIHDHFFDEFEPESGDHRRREGEGAGAGIDEDARQFECANLSGRNASCFCVALIGSINSRPPADRDLETHILSAMAHEQGTRIFRVHDPAGAVRALEMAAALSGERAGAFVPDANSWPWRAGASAAHMTEAEPDKAAPRGQRW